MNFLEFINGNQGKIIILKVKTISMQRKSVNMVERFISFDHEGFLFRGKTNGTKEFKRISYQYSSVVNCNTREGKAGKILSIQIDDEQSKKSLDLTLEDEYDGKSFFIHRD